MFTNTIEKHQDDLGMLYISMHNVHTHQSMESESQLNLKIDVSRCLGVWRAISA